MHLRPNETILKVYHHHPLHYLIQLVLLTGGSLPFFYLLFLFKGALTSSAYIWSNTVIAVLFLTIILHQALIYWLDTLIVTNFRVVYIEWQLLTLKKENETEIHEIQEIRTTELGIFAWIPFLDYGTLSVETAAAHRTFLFDYAPDPEGIKHFIFKQKENTTP